MDRDQRSAVLFTSSMAAEMVFAGAAGYSATKAMISNFGESLNYELKQNVDVTVWEAGSIYSNIHLEEPPSAVTIETSKSVTDILACLGKDRKTRGSLFFSLYPLVPNWMTAPGIEKDLRGKYSKYVELQKEKDRKRQ